MEGDKLLAQKLKGLPDDIKKKALRDATREGAKVVLAKSKEAVPEDTGELAASLRVRKTKFKKKDGQARRVKNVISHSVLTGEGFFKGDQYYGAFLELGTGQRFQKGTGRRTGMINESVHAYLRPALFAESKKVYRIVGATVSKWIKGQSYDRTRRRA